MQRRAFRAVRTTVTWCVIFLMAIDTSIACGLLGGGGCGGGGCGGGGCSPAYYGGCGYGYSNTCYSGSMGCGGVVSYVAPAVYSACDPCYSMAPVYDSAVVSYDAGCCGNVGVSDVYPTEGYVDSGYVESYGEGTVVDSGCAGCATDSYTSEVYSEGGVVSDGVVSEGIVSEGVVSEGAIVDEGVVSEGSGTRMEMPTEAPMFEPAPEMVDPEPFAEPAETAAPATDELFGAEPADAAPEPTATEPADELFGAEPAEAAPAAATEAADMFAPPETAPEAAADADDLFGAEPTDPAAAEAAPAEESAMESLDDMFGEPAAEEPPTPNEEAPAPVEEAPAEEAEDLDDLFGTLQNRAWQDDTGQFSTEGRLASIGEDAIRIFKTNGRHCTVAYYRLSASDFAYVQAIATRLGKPAMQLAAN